MGIGKTTVCQQLNTQLDRSVFLDGDWCWDMHPFQVTEETKTMVLENICYLLNQFLKCSAFDHVIFGWVMDQQEILDYIFQHVDMQNCLVKNISLVCSKRALEDRLRADIAAGLRSPDVLERSPARLSHYDSLRTQKLDATNLSPEETARRIQQLAAQ